MKIVAVSDLYGFLPVIPACDLLIVAGDLGPATREYHRNTYDGRRWLKQSLAPWLESCPAKKIVGVAGNHDFILQRHPDVGRNLPWTYLSDNETEFDGLRIWGSPYTVEFYDWAFMEPDELLAQRWDRIPGDVDILVTHGPPLGHGDLCPDGKRAGSASLAAKTASLDRLKLHVFGHIHDESGYRDGVYANVSLVDEQYLPTNPVRTFELPDRV